MIRFLALGDSYTIGEGVAPADRWPERLVVLLRERGFPIGPPEIVATTGWTTDELDRGIDLAAPAHAPYDLVSLLIGVNNQYRGRAVEAYRLELRALLERAIRFAGGREPRVVVLSIPDWGKTPFAEGRDRARIAAEIAELNVVNHDEAGRRGACWVDVGDPTLLGAGSDQLVCDGLHPSAVVYGRWARLVLPAAERALGR